MITFIVGAIVGAGAAFLFVGFIAAVAEDDERRYLEQQAEARRMKEKQ